MIKMKDIILERKNVDTAGIILKSEWGVILCKDSDKWGIPKGKVELGETPIQAAKGKQLKRYQFLCLKMGLISILQ